MLIERTAAAPCAARPAGGSRPCARCPGFPSALADRLAADLPLDALHRRSGCSPWSALARTYEELAGRVAADTEEMRRRYQAAPPRKRRPPRDRF